MEDITSLKKIAEGKTKIIYANPRDPSTVFMYFKDDITAGDGLKHDVSVCMFCSMLSREG